MSDKIRVGAVSYLNTKPFLFGLEQQPLRSNIQLSYQPPSIIAKDLLSGEIDLGLVPVAVIPQLKEAHIISDFGICCDGEVSSVVICSQMPLKESEKLFIDYQSRTSAALTLILLKEFWKAHPRIVQASPGYEKQVMGKYAGLFIGDRALKLRDRYDYVYDLGDAWKKLTGMPFVFACWVATKKLDQNFVDVFNAALANGIQHIDDVVAIQQPFFPGINIADYLKNKIQYFMDDEKKRALGLFLQLMAEKEKVSL